MKRFNLYQQTPLFQGPYTYVGHMSFADGRLAEMEILPPYLATILDVESKEVQAEAESAGFTVDSPEDIFRGHFWNISVFEADNDPHFSEVWL